jgi:hypothetical protein
MTRTKNSNTDGQNTPANLIWQLSNLEAAMRKHAPDSPEFRYLVKERIILLAKLEDAL